MPFFITAKFIQVTDADFLGKVEPLTLFLGPSFRFVRNPFLLAQPRLPAAAPDPDDISVDTAPALPKPTLPAAVANTDPLSSPASSFGTPTSSVARLGNGVVEWFGHVTSSDVVIVGKDAALVPATPVPRSRMASTVRNHGGRAVDIISVDRLAGACDIIMEEERIAALMGAKTEEEKMKEEAAAREIEVRKRKMRKLRLARDAGEITAGEFRTKKLAAYGLSEGAPLPPSSSEEDDGIDLLAHSPRAGTPDTPHPLGDVATVYGDAFGASLVVNTTLEKRKHQVENVFCREDAGEWVVSSNRPPFTHVRVNRRNT